MKKNILKFAYIALALVSMSTLRQSSAFAQNKIDLSCSDQCTANGTTCINGCSLGTACIDDCQSREADCHQGC
jgi:hypothetical protein